MHHQERAVGWLIGLMVISVIGAAIYLVIAQFQGSSQIRIGDAILSADIADTEELREQGLSGRSELKPNQALLFVFDTSDKWGIWMKDMNFAIDIIWMNADKEVVYIVKNAQPDSYPETTYIPRVPAKYVLEVPAGTVDSRSIRIGQRAIFDTN